ncbi:MAG: InlB B-repeat-containing protein [Clostridia bacterium]|nr:InlB B-repeat-containing protein [Clostridia bacterium]
MKRRYQYKWSTLLAVLLLAGILFSAMLPVQSAGEIDARLNYANPNDGVPQNLSALELFELLFDTEMTEEERTYLSQLSSLKLTYSTTSAELESGISTFVDKENNCFVASVKPYTYTATNGETVEWIPQSARIAFDGSILERSFTYEDGIWRTAFEDINRSGDFDMEVTFAWKETLSESVYEVLLNDAYRAGSEALETVLADEAIKADYDKRYAAFAAYRDFLQQQKDYDDYVLALRYHDEVSMPAYRDYQASLSSYQADTAAYEAWQRYFDFLESGTTFEDYVNYRNYMEQIKRMKQRLNVLDVLFLLDSNGWDFYDSLMGGSVTSALLGNKEELEMGGFKAEVRAAEESTVALRTLMKGYSDLRDAKYASEHDRVVALYTYYINNYVALRDNFKKLSDALFTFLNSPLICIAIKEQGGAKRFAHYEQFVALLYTTSTALDDREKRPETWPGEYPKNYTAFLDEKLLVNDNNTAKHPDQEKIPAEEVPFADWMDSPPALPQITKQPKLENYLSDEVKEYLAEHGADSLNQEPVAPAPVDDPSLGIVPDFAEDPGDPPVPTELDDRLRALAEKVRAGILRERTPTGGGLTFRLEKTVERRVSVENKRVITFYAHDRQTVLDRQVLEYGQRFSYNGPDSVYTREPSASHTYEYLGWFLLDGETRAEMVATSDLSIYAKYREKIRVYPVTWILDGMKSTSEVEYGVLPKCPFQTNKAPDEGYTYTFSGWRVEGTDRIGVSEVTGAVTYVGSITRIPNPYTVTWMLGDRTETVTVPYGEFPIYDGVPQRAPDDYVYTFLKWNKPLDWVRADVTYEAEWEKKPLATSIDGEMMEIRHSESAVTVVATHPQVDIREAAKLAQASGKSLVVRWDRFLLTVEKDQLAGLTQTTCRRIHLIERIEEGGSVSYTFGYFNSAGLSQDVDISATLCGMTDSGEPMAGYLLENGVWQSVGTEAVTVKGGASFRVTPAYRIDFLNADKCNIANFPELVGVGERVDLHLGCVFGYEVTAAKVTMEDGTTVAVDGLSFLMPSGNVKVELTVTPIVYHVIFVSDGKVIAEADYLLGEEIIPPEDPIKPSDGVYDYTFGGWSKDVTVAYGDDRNPVYEAIFSVTPIPVYNHSLSTIDVIVLIVLPIVIGLTLIGGGFLIVRRVIKKKKAAAASAKNERQGS